MATTDVLHKSITRTAGVCGGKPCIVGTRVRVQDVVRCTQLGDAAADVARAFPGITVADVDAALAYYHENRVAMDREIMESDELVERVRAMSNTLGPGRAG